MRKVAGRIEMRPEATATRCVSHLALTSTMRALPLRSKWVSCGDSLRRDRSFTCVLRGGTRGSERYHNRMRLLAWLLAACWGLTSIVPDSTSAEKLITFGRFGND